VAPEHNSRLTVDDVVKNYGLEPISPSVGQLTQLVAKQNAPLDELAQIVRDDRALTARLLRAANPAATKPEEYTITTVNQALMRNGLRSFFLLAMGDPIVRAVGKTCRTMLGMDKVAMVNVKSVEPLQGEHVLGEVEFDGQAHGAVHFRMSMRGARFMAGRLLGIENPAEMLESATIDDVVGELANITAGNLHSNLRDAGLDVKLCPPKISRTSDFRARCVPGGCTERMTFVMPSLTLFVDLSVNPWNE
jgi:CheY-specific phosphatase CheX